MLWVGSGVIVIVTEFCSAVFSYGGCKLILDGDLDCEFEWVIFSVGQFELLPLTLSESRWSSLYSTDRLDLFIFFLRESLRWLKNVSHPLSLEFFFGVGVVGLCEVGVA